MKRKRLNLVVVYDEEPDDIHPEAIAASVRRHLRTTGHPALKTAEVIPQEVR